MKVIIFFALYIAAVCLCTGFMIVCRRGRK